ncbi:MAG: BRO family protein, partial [Dolichospermum sp.]
MTNISVFEFDSNELEIAMVDNQPWFNASQVAKALGYSNPS